MLLQETEILLYRTNDDTVKIDVLAHDNTLWLTQKKMSELFAVKIPNINKHLKSIFDSGELQEHSVISKMEITASDGKKYKTNFYNLDAIIAVGYRVNSKQATQFRIWATHTLHEFIVKGFVLDSERLKNGQNFGKNMGNISAKVAKAVAEKEYQTFRIEQDNQYKSDFDQLLEHVKDVSHE